MVKSEFYGSGEGVHKNPISWGGLPKEGWLKQFADLKGGEAWQKRGGGVLRMGSQEGGGGGLIPQCTVCLQCLVSKQIRCGH